MDYKLQRCEREQYPAFLAMLDDAFGFESGWFVKNKPSCTPRAEDAVDNEIANHIIATNGGKVIGGAGVYEMDWVVSDANKSTTVKAFGIGQLACGQAYRNQGVMKALMNAVTDEFTGAGRVVSFLGGDRFRYGLYGYDFGGNTVKYHLNKYRFEKNINRLDINTKKAGVFDWQQLNVLYEQLPSYIKRNELKWKRHLENKDVTFFIGEYQGRQGYVCYKDFCVEASGDLDVVLNLLYYCMCEFGMDNAVVCYPYLHGLPDTLSEALYNTASWTEVVQYGLFAFHDPEAAFAQLSGMAAKQTRQNINGLNVQQKESLLRRLFGYAYRPLPVCIKEFTDIRPICIWGSYLDKI